MTAPDLTPAGIAARRAKRRGGVVKPFTWRAKLLGAVVGALFAALLLNALVTVTIWPGEAKLFAPIVCSDARPDPVIVYDTHQVRPGETSITFEMYCMGPRGDVESHGFMKIFGIALVFHTLVVLALIGARMAWKRLGAARERSAVPANPLIS